MNAKPSRDDATGAAPTIELAVSGMTCEGCARAVNRVLDKVPGVAGAKVDVAAGRARVTGNAPAQALIDAVVAAGYGARLAGEGNAR
jgi:copper chaperone CopZ